MELRCTHSGRLLRYRTRLELRLFESTLERFSDFLTVLPTDEELATCRNLVLDLSSLSTAYPSLAAVLAAWIQRHEPLLEADNFELDYIAPDSPRVERWLDSVGFTHHVLNTAVRVRRKDRYRTMVLHEIAPGARDASDTVADDVDALIKRNGIPVRSDLPNPLFAPLSEVVENITRHAHISSSAFACAQVHPQTSKFSVCIADAGIGLAESFRIAPYAPARRRMEAGDSPLDLAIEPLMSSKYGMGHSGYGLFYTSELCALSKGTFWLTSGTESLVIYPNGRYKKSQGPWRGTIVHMLLDTSALVDDSQVWQKLAHLDEEDTRVRYLESHPACFELRAFGPRLLTRDMGAQIRTVALGRGAAELAVSLNGIEVMTPSFADEFFGGLYTHLGPIQFSTVVAVIDCDDYTSRLIETVLKHRAERHEQLP